MNFDPALLRESAVFLILFAASFAAGFGFGRWRFNLAGYYQGHKDGRNEERCRQNRRIIPAKMEGCKAGREAERMIHLQN